MCPQSSNSFDFRQTCRRTHVSSSSQQSCVVTRPLSPRTFFGYAVSCPYCIALIIHTSQSIVRSLRWDIPPEIFINPAANARLDDRLRYHLTQARSYLKKKVRKCPLSTGSLSCTHSGHGQCCRQQQRRQAAYLRACSSGMRRNKGQRHHRALRSHGSPRASYHLVSAFV